MFHCQFGIKASSFTLAKQISFSKSYLNSIFILSLSPSHILEISCNQGKLWEEKTKINIKKLPNYNRVTMGGKSLNQNNFKMFLIFLTKVNIYIMVSLPRMTLRISINTSFCLHFQCLKFKPLGSAGSKLKKTGHSFNFTRLVSCEVQLQNWTWIGASLQFSCLGLVTMIHVAYTVS